jgi:hypothetical protein
MAFNFKIHVFEHRNQGITREFLLFGYLVDPAFFQEYNPLLSFLAPANY